MSEYAVAIEEFFDQRAERETRPVTRGTDVDVVNAWFAVDSWLSKNPEKTEAEACQRLGIAIEAYRKAKKALVATERECHEFLEHEKYQPGLGWVKIKFNGRRRDSKITDDQVREIRRRVDADERYCDIARALGVSRTAVRLIAIGNSRKGVQ